MIEVLIEIDLVAPNSQHLEQAIASLNYLPYFSDIKGSGVVFAFLLLHFWQEFMSGMEFVQNFLELIRCSLVQFSDEFNNLFRTFSIFFWRRGGRTHIFLRSPLMNAYFGTWPIFIVGLIIVCFIQSMVNRICESELVVWTFVGYISTLAAIIVKKIKSLSVVDNHQILSDILK